MTRDQAWCEYCALNSLGDIKKTRGNLNGALKLFQESLSYAEGLAAQDEKNADWQRDISVSYNRVGDVQQLQGDSAALKSYLNSLAIADRLAKSAPGNALWQRDISVSYNRVGDVQQLQGDLQPR